MHVIFVEPSFPANQREFVRALHAVGASVTGVGERPVEWLDDELKGWLTNYVQIQNVTDEAQLLDAVQSIQRRGWVDRLVASIESHMLATARVREETGIPGVSVETTLICRDKPLMKEFLSRHGVPCARTLGADDRDEILAFAREVGFPLIVKPRAGAGAAGTFKVDDTAQLAAALTASGVGNGGAVAVEEFIEGHEGFYDTMTIGGVVTHEFISHYYPNVLEAMRTRECAPQIVVTNRNDAPGYKELRQLGHQVIDALGIDTSATHMEWFFGPKGLKFSEIGARPPGVRQWDLYCAANEIDLYREWAMGVCYRRPSQQNTRRFAAGLVALRPERDGVITGYSGVDILQEKLGAYVIDAHLPPPGTPTQPVEAGFMANAWVRMKHPDYDTLRELLDTVGRTLRVHSR